MGTGRGGVDPDGLVVFAEDDARLIRGDVFRADKGVHGHVLVALSVVRVLVIAHGDPLLSFSFSFCL